MFDDYQKQVLQKYKEKSVAGNLSSRLIHPTPGNLKEECMVVYQERFNRRDLQILRTFFGTNENQEVDLPVIKRIEIDRFRPLQKFLSKPGYKTDARNVELLAWLIDFQPRPFDYRKSYIGVETEDQEIKKAVNQGGDEIIDESQPAEKAGEYESEIETVPATAGIIAGSTAGNSKKRFFIVGGIMLALICAVLYGLFVASPPSPKGECMYWAEDHYQPIPCTQKIEGKLIIALDTVKVRHFKKITDPKAIILAPKGSIWYVKINGEVECFTSAGYHPTEIKRRLWPITDRIIDIYIRPKLNAQQ